MRVLQVFTSGISCGLVKDLPLFMRNRGVEVLFAAAAAPQLAEHASRTGTRVYEIPMNRAITPLSDLIGAARLWVLLRHLRPDIVTTHTPKASLLAAIAAFALRIPVLHVVHGLPHLSRGGLEGWLVREAERVSCRLARRVICVSPSIREVLVRQKLCPSEKTMVLGAGTFAGIDADLHFNPERLPAGTRERVRNEYGIANGALVVGYCGRVVKDKGIRELAVAWEGLRRRYSELYLLIVGPFEQQDPVPPDTLQILRYDSRIVTTHAVRDPTPFYAAMDLLVLPSYREGFGMVAAEANAMELPVVATDIPGCVDAIEDGQTGTLIPPRDSAALEEAVARYLDNPTLRVVQGRKGRARVLQHFRPSDRYEAVYIECLRILEGASPHKGFT